MTEQVFVSDRSIRHTDQHAPGTPVSAAPLLLLTPHAPKAVEAPHRQVTMADKPVPLTVRNGRPIGPESLRRRELFVRLLAANVDPVEARKAARLDHDAALRITCRADFQQLVEAVRETGEPVTVTVADTNQLAA